MFCRDFFLDTINKKSHLRWLLARIDDILSASKRASDLLQHKHHGGPKQVSHISCECLCVTNGSSCMDVTIVKFVPALWTRQYLLCYRRKKIIKKSKLWCHLSSFSVVSLSTVGKFNFNLITGYWKIFQTSYLTAMEFVYLYICIYTTIHKYSHTLISYTVQNLHFKFN